MSTPRRLHPLVCCSILALGLAGCVRETNNQGGGTNTSSELQTRVGNNDPRGADDQPDWDSQSRELKQRVDPRMPAQLPTDKQAVCTKMIDEVTAFYISIESNPEQRSARMAQLQQTREQDISGCVEQTSVAAAVCVTILLGDRNSEFPWLLDQCSRAYPSEGEEGEVVGVGPSKADALELTFVGDIIFGRYREGNVFDPIIDTSKIKADAPLPGPFAEIQSALTSDVLVGNLETPVVDTLPAKSPINSSIRFGGGGDEVQHLADAGFSVMSLANNHFFDLREEGQRRSPAVLAQAGILGIGASRSEAPVFRLEPFEAKGWKLGFISVTNRINAPVPKDPPSPDKPVVPYIAAHDMSLELLPLVENDRANYDLIVVAVHWGDEYADAPNNKLQRVARELIDGGVDMVIGHHPHVLQGVEAYGDGLIAYSMGNFLFENTGEIPRMTGVLRARWFDRPQGPCLDQVDFHPAYVKRSPYPHPVAATGGMAKRVRKRVSDQAKALGTSFVEVADSEDLRIEGLAPCS